MTQEINNEKRLSHNQKVSSTLFGFLTSAWLRSLIAQCYHIPWKLSRRKIKLTEMQNSHIWFINCNQSMKEDKLFTFARIRLELDLGNWLPKKSMNLRFFLWKHFLLFKIIQRACVFHNSINNKILQVRLILCREPEIMLRAWVFMHGTRFDF